MGVKKQTMNCSSLLARTSLSSSLLMRQASGRRTPVVLSMSGSSAGSGDGEGEGSWNDKTFEHQVLNQQQAMDTYVSQLRGYQLPFSFTDNSKALKWPRSGRL